MPPFLLLRLLRLFKQSRSRQSRPPAARAMFKHLRWFRPAPEAFDLFKRTTCHIKFFMAGKNSYPV